MKTIAYVFFVFFILCWLSESYFSDVSLFVSLLVNLTVIVIVLARKIYLGNKLVGE